MVRYLPVLNNLVKFYKESKPCITDSNNSYVKALAHKKGLRYKRVMLGNDLDILDILPPDIRTFYARNADMFVIPIDDPYCLRGFVFRAVNTKEFRIVTDGFPMFFGLYNFFDFQYGDLIIVAEGLKDALAISTIYPYALACLGSHITVKQADWLKKISTNIVFMGDNDRAGRAAEYQNLKAGCKAVYFLPSSKDAGTLFERDNTEVESYIKTIVKINRRSVDVI